MSELAAVGEASVPDGDAQRVDAALLARIAGGEQAALAELYDRFSRPLFAVAVRILQDAAEAEDILHDVFVTVWEKARDFQATRGNAFAWTATLTRNRAIDRLRSRRRRAELLAASAPGDLGYTESGADDQDLGNTLWLKEKAGAVRRAVATLPPEQREAVELAFFGGLTQQEISANLSAPLGTIKARIRRGLLKLRDLLRPQL